MVSRSTATAIAAVKTGSMVMMTAALVALSAAWAHRWTARPTPVAARARWATERHAVAVAGPSRGCPTLVEAAETLQELVRELVP